MQDKDTEAINNQRKRRKRIGRIRNGIIMTIAGWIILCQKLSMREIIGCVVMFTAIVLAQLPQKETA